jgi:hypothetical protein
MAGITYFVALPFDVADGSVVVGEPIECPSPAAAIDRAQGLWKVLGHWRLFGARERPANILKRRRSKSRRRSENAATASRTGKISGPLANVATCSK